MSGFRDRPLIRTRTVVEVEFNRGRGVEGDPVRRVFAYYDEDGVLLAERDTLNPEFTFVVEPTPLREAANR